MTPTAVRPPSVPRAALAAVTLLVLAALAAPAGAQVEPNNRNNEMRRDVDVSKIRLTGSIQLSADQLALAGSIRPVAPAALEAHVPEALGAFRRVSRNGFTRSFGPMAVTLVKSVYESDDGRVEIEIFDPGGMPIEGDNVLPMLPDGLEAPGDTVSFLGQRAGAHEGTLKSDRKTNRAIYQVRLGPRMRVTATAELALAPALAELVTRLDLDALAALAPEAPPSLEPDEDDAE